MIMELLLLVAFAAIVCTVLEIMDLRHQVEFLEYDNRRMCNALHPPWKSRTEMLPGVKGNKLWASDGERVWDIWDHGGFIGPYATNVLWWTEKYHPDPPPPDLVPEKTVAELREEFEATLPPNSWLKSTRY